MSTGTSIQQIQGIVLPPRALEPQASPKDFNGDVLVIGDHVMFAIGRGQLGEGIVVEGTQHAGAVTIQSTICAERCITIAAEGCIKVAL